MVISKLHLPGCYIVAEASGVSISNRNTWHRPAVPRDLLLLPCKLDYNDAGTPFAELYAEPRVAGLSLNDNHLPLTCWNGRKLLGTMHFASLSRFKQFSHVKNAIIVDKKLATFWHREKALNLLWDLIKRKNKRFSRCCWRTLISKKNIRKRKNCIYPQP